jgi:hypothetical protein
MVALANEFEQLVRSSNLTTERKEGDEGIFIHVRGRHGSAGVDFTEDGDIIAMVDAELIHSWRPLPNDADMRASAKKIRDLIG